MTLTAAILGVLQTRVNAGLRQNAQRLCPSRSGDLKRSMVLQTRQQHGAIVIQVRLLDYFRYQQAVGVRKNLVGAVGALLLQTLRSALGEGAQIHLLQTLNAWGLPQQRAISRTIPGSLVYEFEVFLLNDGRTR